MDDGRGVAQIVDDDVRENVTALVVLDIPEIRIPINDRLASDERTDRLTAHHVAFPPGVFPKAVAEQFSIAFVVGPSIPEYSLSDHESIDRLIGLARTPKSFQDD